MRIKTIAAFAAGVVVAASGSALATTKLAAIVGPDNQIHGCYLTSAGLLRVVAAGAACRDGESAIAWSATGSGAQGPVGPMGPAGASWRGAWVSGTSYKAGDLVRRDGSVWIYPATALCFIGNANCSNTVPPPTNPIWQRFAVDGQAGPRGQQGPQGPPGPESTHLLHTLTVSTGVAIVQGVVVPGTTNDLTQIANCPAGSVVTGGGYNRTSVPLYAAVDVLSSHAVGDSGWKVHYVASGLTKNFVSTWATCARLD